MKPWKPVDFAELVAEVKQPLFGRDELTILGGQCAESELLKLIEYWDLASMPFRVWEYCSEIIFEKDTLPNNLALLERGRVFGEGGDLMLRRSDKGFSWRFIGPAGIREPAGKYGMQKYWIKNQDAIFHQDQKKAILWGKWNGERWVEDKVGAAKLNYPASGQRVQLWFKVFSYAGQVEFVWYTGLSEWRDAEND
jgi:hypothetical protein